jgi:gluconokinase
MNMHIVVMGVAGCGKTTVAEAFRDRKQFVMAEGDDFHSKANVDKMSHGVPLTDDDRWPWLASINAWMAQQDKEGKSTVVSCSALKRSYRDVLRKNLNVYFIHLSGSQELIGGRLSKRTGHYMPPSLLPSQFADLQPLEADEPGAVISVAGTPLEVEDAAIKAVEQYRDSQHDD